MFRRLMSVCKILDWVGDKGVRHAKFDPDVFDWSVLGRGAIGDCESLVAGRC